jgi:hypothetical protein
MIQAEIIGADGVVRDLEKYGKEAGKAIKKAVDDTAKAIESDAKKRLNGMMGSAKHWITGTLAKSVHKQLSASGDLATNLDPFESAVGSNLKYAPYIEFGTGDFVDIMPGWEDIAIKFKGKKKVRGFKGDSFLGWASLNQSKKLPERITKELNKVTNTGKA